MMGGVMQLKSLALLVSAALLACGESLPDSESDVVRILYDMMNK